MKELEDNLTQVAVVVVAAAAAAAELGSCFSGGDMSGLLSQQ